MSIEILNFSTQASLLLGGIPQKPAYSYEQVRLLRFDGSSLQEDIIWELTQFLLLHDFFGQALVTIIYDDVVQSAAVLGKVEG